MLNFNLIDGTHHRCEKRLNNNTNVKNV